MDCEQLNISRITKSSTLLKILTEIRQEQENKNKTMNTFKFRYNEIILQIRDLVKNFTS
jgi:hypothetical protein